VPKISSPSCGQPVFVDQTTEAGLSSDAVVLKIDWSGRRLQQCRPGTGIGRPVLSVVVIVIAQDPPQMALVSEKSAA
jgi:hypothetical protein